MRTTRCRSAGQTLLVQSETSRFCSADREHARTRARDLQRQLQEAENACQADAALRTSRLQGQLQGELSGLQVRLAASCVAKGPAGTDLAAVKARLHQQERDNVNLREDVLQQARLRHSLQARIPLRGCTGLA